MGVIKHEERDDIDLARTLGLHSTHCLHSLVDLCRGTLSAGLSSPSRHAWMLAALPTRRSWRGCRALPTSQMTGRRCRIHACSDHRGAMKVLTHARATTRACELVGCMPQAVQVRDSS